jgi:hypothetical protein
LAGLLALLASACDGERAQHAELVAALERGAAREALDTAAPRLEELRVRAADEEPLADDERRFVHDAALAALAAGDLSRVELLATWLALGADEEFVARGHVLLGAARHERARLAAEQALGPEVEPFAFDAALGQVRSARAAFVRALLVRPEWPALARDLERCALLESRIERAKAQAEAARARREADAQPNVEVVPTGDGAAPEPDETDETDETDDEAPAAERLAPLSPEELAALVEVLAAKEREKILVRRAARERAGAAVLRDW